MIAKKVTFHTQPISSVVTVVISGGWQGSYGKFRFEIFASCSGMKMKLMIYSIKNRLMWFRLGNGGSPKS